MKISFLCATWRLKDFGVSSQNNSYFNSMNFCFLCATSQLRDFGSSIQDNSYFNSMKFFFLCALLHNWRILVLQFKTTHTSSTQWNFSSFVRYFTIEGFWFFDSKQLILLQLHEKILPLCATSQLKDFGSSIQNNLYFFNSMKKFFLCVLLHNWRILVLRFKTTHTSSTQWNFSSFVRYFTIEGFWFFNSKQLILLQLNEIFASFVLLHNWKILVLRFKTTHTSSTQWNFSSFVRYFTIEGFWFFDSKQLILLQIEFHSYLKHQKHWSHCVSKRKKKKKTTHTLCWSTICMPFH